MRNCWLKNICFQLDIVKAYLLRGLTFNSLTLLRTGGTLPVCQDNITLHLPKQVIGYYQSNPGHYNWDNPI